MFNNFKFNFGKMVKFLFIESSFNCIFIAATWLSNLNYEKIKHNNTLLSQPHKIKRLNLPSVKAFWQSDLSLIKNYHYKIYNEFLLTNVIIK